MFSGVMVVGGDREGKLVLLPPFFSEAGTGNAGSFYTQLPQPPQPCAAQREVVSMAQPHPSRGVA